MEDNENNGGDNIVRLNSEPSTPSPATENVETQKRKLFESEEEYDLYLLSSGGDVDYSDVTGVIVITLFNSPSSSEDDIVISRIHGNNNIVTALGSLEMVKSSIMRDLSTLNEIQYHE